MGFFEILNVSLGNLVMIIIGCFLLYLGIKKRYEPLLLLPIGFGAILTNIPNALLTEKGGLLYYFYLGIESGIFPPLIFLGVGALTDFGPLLSNPKTFLLGAAAQFGIFGTILGALYLGFTPLEAASIGIIGGADGPTAIYLSSKLAPHILGPVAVAAYSYMALIPLIQPPIVKLLTTKEQRRCEMKQLKPISQDAKIAFPMIMTIVVALLVPQATPLIGMLMLGNLLRESGVTQRLSQTSSNEIINIVTILLGVAVGSTMSAQNFLNLQTIQIILLGLLAFSIGTAFGVLFGVLMYHLTRHAINPIIGAAGVSAVPMAARVSQKLGQEENPKNHLLMHAMGPNVSGVIGSAVAAGVLLAILS
ncbi:MAG: sodium ion-translocating decarboxylase subunit beta [Candidatus Methanofastidiosia archaeon]